MTKTSATAKKKIPAKPDPKATTKAKAKTLPTKAAEPVKTKATSTPVASAAKRVVEEIPLVDIQPDPNQPRQLPGQEVADIADSIIVDADGNALPNHGIDTPIHVRKTPPGAPTKAKWMIIFGERRYWAAKQRCLKTIPAEIIVIAEEDVYPKQLLENIAQRPFSPSELLVAVAKLKKSPAYRNKPDEDIAYAVGLRSAREVRKYLVLAALAPEVRAALAKDPSVVGNALLVATVPLEDQAEAFAAIAKLERRQGVNTIENRYHLRLASDTCGFDPADATLAGGACGKCPKSTAQQRSLWSEGDAKSDDRCTDRKCFDAKRETTSTRKVEAAKKAGAREATPEEAKQLFPSAHTTAAHTDEMLDLDTVCDVVEPAEGEKRPTWREALAKGGMQGGELVTRDGAGKVHELIGIDKAADALAAGGFTKAAETLKAESEIGPAVDRSVALRREREANQKAFAAAGAGAVAAMKASVSSMKPLDFLRAIASIVVHIEQGEAERIARAMGLKPVSIEAGEEDLGTEWTRALLVWIDMPASASLPMPMREAELRGLILEFAAGPAPLASTEHLREDEAFMIACERTSVDLRALRAEAIEESKAPAKPD